MRNTVIDWRNAIWTTVQGQSRNLNHYSNTVINNSNESFVIEMSKRAAIKIDLHSKSVFNFWYKKSYFSVVKNDGQKSLIWFDFFENKRIELQNAHLNHEHWLYSNFEIKTYQKWWKRWKMWRTKRWTISNECKVTFWLFYVKKLLQTKLVKFCFLKCDALKYNLYWM